MFGFPMFNPMMGGYGQMPAYGNPYVGLGSLGFNPMMGQQFMQPYGVYGGGYGGGYGGFNMQPLMQPAYGGYGQGQMGGFFGNNPQGQFNTQQPAQQSVQPPPPPQEFMDLQRSVFERSRQGQGPTPEEIQRLQQMQNQHFNSPEYQKARDQYMSQQFSSPMGYGIGMLGMSRFAPQNAMGPINNQAMMSQIQSFLSRMR